MVSEVTASMVSLVLCYLFHLFSLLLSSFSVSQFYIFLNIFYSISIFYVFCIVKLFCMRFAMNYIIFSFRIKLLIHLYLHVATSPIIIYTHSLLSHNINMCMVIPKLGVTATVWREEKTLPVPVTQSTKQERGLWRLPLLIVLVYLLWRRLGGI